MILVALLVLECCYGSPGREAAEYVKMVSKSPGDLLGNRTLLGTAAALRRAGLVEILDPMDGKEITGDLTLPRWVSALLLGDDEASAVGSMPTPASSSTNTGGASTTRTASSATSRAGRANFARRLRFRIRGARIFSP